MKFNNLPKLLFDYLNGIDNANTVYHVTSDFYKNDIVQNGLVRKAYLESRHINSLKQLLNKPDFQDLNVNITYPFGFPNETIIEAIENSFNNSSSTTFPISACESFTDVFRFLTEDFKGGQYLKRIKELVKTINQRICDNASLINQIDNNVLEVIDFIKKITKVVDFKNLM